ncbi:MAG: Rieske (2Fe-2S) protein [Deltaproteobacteria bacterium]|nr:Rieske (2Fe-2S) protein [Deltaproteobacteria bacterium]
MAEYRKAANVKDVSSGSGMVMQIDDKRVALFNVGGNFYAIDNTCKHRGGPLGDGELDGTTVICPWHGWQYDVTSGQCKTNPQVCVTRYDVKVEGDEIKIAL